ncbi:MAG: SDR family oxidoreductase [Myxococcales bacterium]|nr:SDR family oxidoreductase [Myxococcales bacterium]
MGLFASLKPRGPSGFGASSTAEQVTRGLDLAGQTFLLTGCNSGIGLETLRVLGLRGARVLAAARTEDKARQAIAACGPSAAGAIPLACELSEPASVRACVAAVKALGAPLAAIVANAGIMALPKLEIVHGLELQFLTNHLGHFLLVTELVDALADDGRVVLVSSSAHRRAPRAGIDFDNLAGETGYAPWAAYGRSKLANLLFAKELARRLAGSRRTANAIHPGVIGTNLTRSMGAAVAAIWSVTSRALLKSVPQGAATQCYVACHPDVAGVSGECFSDCNVARPSALALDEALARRLWDESERLVAALG